MKKVKKLLALLLACSMVFTLIPAYAADAEADRSVHSGITIDENPDGGYTGDYVVIYNPSTDYTDARSTGTLTGLIDTTINPNVRSGKAADSKELYKIDIDGKMAELSRKAGVESAADIPLKKDGPSSFQVGDTYDFQIAGDYSPTGSSTVTFKCLYVGEHCYIWTPVEDNGVSYPLDTLGADFAEIAAAEFDSKFDLMQYSFGDHMDFGTGDNRLHMLYYNICDGWQPSRGYIAGFFYAYDLVLNSMPILNIDTYPGVYYPDYYGEGKPWIRTDTTYSTMVHEYQHLINFSLNYTKGTMHQWLNESFSAAAEEICYPGSSVVARAQAWTQYYPSNASEWLNPPAEVAYQPDFYMHNGYSLYDWDNNLYDVLTLYAQVSFFAQYLYTRFGNGIYHQISDVFTQNGQEAAAISAATGIDCSQLAKEFRVAVTANATQDQYDGIYGFKVQEGYDPAKYHNVNNPWDLLCPVVFTGSSCSLKGGGSITVKPVGGVYNPPADADPNLEYIGIKLAPPAEYVVDYMVCGTVESSETVLENVSVTLPAEVSAEVEGWTFAGWTEQNVASTSEAPAYLAPGASYTPTQSVTLYALFTRTVDSETLYQSDPVTTHTPVLVPAVEPKCTEPGNSAYYTCATCDKLFSDESCTTETTLESTVIPANGHTPGEPVKENETNPSCTDVGGYDMVTYCTVCDAELSREHTEIPANGHTPGEPVKANETNPSCTEVGGYDMVTYCTVCNAELSREHTEIPANGHTPGEPVKENETAATCIEPGGYDLVTYCTVCGEELSREHTETDPALGHDWDEPSYEWAEDNSSVTATRICKNDETHMETETVATTSEVTKEATYEEEGEITYTAVFENEAFETQTKAVATPKLEKPEPVNPFDDVTESDYFYEPVLWAVNHEPQITNGTDPGKFSPNAKCTRGQVVTFLWRAKGCPEPTATENPFSDVKDSEYYYKAVLWAVENEITTGTGNGKFSPNQGCTRGQVVTFLWRTEGKPEPAATENPFNDVKDSDYFYTAVLWAVENGITQGTDPGKFSPNATCTRGQIVTFLYRDLAA